MNDGRDWLDLTVIAVSIISPILVLATVIFTAIAAFAAKRATELNSKLFKEQKIEKEELKKSAFLTEYSKLHASIYFVPHFESLLEDKVIHDLPKMRVVIELAFNGIQKVDISVFSNDMQHKINLITTNLGFRLAEIRRLEEQGYVHSDEGENFASQYYLLSNIISELLQGIRNHEYLK